MDADLYEPKLLRLVASITSAHVSNNRVEADALPDIIKTVYTALSTAGLEIESDEKPRPAVPVKKSVFADYIVCLEDGRKMKTLRRYLQARYDMTPDDYRKRWDLSADYPMVAPNYAAKRSAIAKELGLGRKPGAVEPKMPAIQRIPERTRGRKLRTNV